MSKILLVLSVFCITSSIIWADLKDRKAVSQYLQEISVTIKSEGRYSKSEGSGVLFVREIGGSKVTFVWTAAHVVDNLRSVRERVDSKGATRKLVEFKDPKIVKELIEDGRRVGEIKMDARVIKYSDYDHGQDLALLMVRAKDYGKSSTRFYLDPKEEIIPIGTQLFHVGSLLGQMGANSMTSGIIAQVGRIQGKVEFDQTTVTAFPGSSGGGVFLQDGRYVGMLVRGAGENFNLIVPIRRMKAWASKHKLLWALDPHVKAPPLDEILDIAVEDSVFSGDDSDDEKSSELPFLIKVEPIKPRPLK